LNRLFLLRYHDKLLYLPRNANQAMSVTSEEKPGTWYIVKTDVPEHAFNHQRQLLARGFGCVAIGSCSRCSVETQGKGTRPQAMAMLTGRQWVRAPDATGPDIGQDRRRAGSRRPVRLDGG
jgi:hypothetical protein